MNHGPAAIKPAMELALKRLEVISLSIQKWHFKH